MNGQAKNSHTAYPKEYHSSIVQHHELLTTLLRKLEYLSHFHKHKQVVLCREQKQLFQSVSTIHSNRLENCKVYLLIGFPIELTEKRNFSEQDPQSKSHLDVA